MATESDSIDAGMVLTIGLGSGFVIAATVIMLQVVSMRIDADLQEQKGTWREPQTIVGPNVDYDKLKADEYKRMMRPGKWQEYNPVTGKPMGEPQLHISVDQAMDIVAQDLAKHSAETAGK